MESAETETEQPPRTYQQVYLAVYRGLERTYFASSLVEARIVAYSAYWPGVRYGDIDVSLYTGRVSKPTTVYL